MLTFDRQVVTEHLERAGTVTKGAGDLAFDAYHEHAENWHNWRMPTTRKPRRLVPQTFIHCFVAGTLVRTKDGMKPIEEIRVGDWVMSYPENGDMSNRRRVGS